MPLSVQDLKTTPKPQAARAFSKIGASSLAGGMVGGFVAKGLGHLVEPKWLIFFGALTVFGTVGLVAYTHRRFPSNVAPRKTREDAKSGYDQCPCTTELSKGVA